MGRTVVPYGVRQLLTRTITVHTVHDFNLLELPSLEYFVKLYRTTNGEDTAAAADVKHILHLNDIQGDSRRFTGSIGACSRCYSEQLSLIKVFSI